MDENEDAKTRERGGWTSQENSRELEEWRWMNDGWAAEWIVVVDKTPGRTT